MSAHLTEEEIDRLQAGRVSPAQVAAIGKHLSSCEVCAARVSAFLDLPRMVSDVRIQLEADEGALAEVDEPVVEPVRRDRFRWVFAVAAALAIVSLLMLIFTLQRARTITKAPVPVIASDTTTAPPVGTQAPASYGRSEWDRWVADAVKTGRFEMPAMLAALRPPAAQLRGEGEGDDQALRPNGVVIHELRPRFHWKGQPGARYVVVLALDGEPVVESKELDQPAWQPPFDLKRGREYAWQVELTAGDRRTTYPRPPRPPARFRILDGKAAAEIDEARERFPNDPLLHAVLFARHGLTADAERSLAVYRKSGRAELADALLRSIRGWNQAGVPWGE